MEKKDLTLTYIINVLREVLNRYFVEFYGQGSQTPYKNDDLIFKKFRFPIQNIDTLFFYLCFEIQVRQSVPKYDTRDGKRFVTGFVQYIGETQGNFTPRIMNGVSQQHFYFTLLYTLSRTMYHCEFLSNQRNKGRKKGSHGPCYNSCIIGSYF